MKTSSCLALSSFVAALALAPVSGMAQTGDFYQGKTVQFMVGYGPSGAFDAYTRIAARFIGKHIPGNPTVIVNNMPGASSLQFVRYMQTAANKDGTQFGMFNRGLMPKSVLEPKETGVDFTRFNWIGSMNSEMSICYFRKDKGIKSLEDARKIKFTLGDTSKNSGGYIYTSILHSLTPDTSRIVLGYANTGDIWLAIERGEIDGNCTLMTSIESLRPEWLPKGMIDVIVQFNETKHKTLPTVPTIFEVLKSDQEKQAINFLIASEEIGRPIIAPLGVPADRVAILRKAFDSMMKDPEFIAAAEKLNMEMDPISGEKAAAIAASIQNTPREAVELARKLMD